MNCTPEVATEVQGYIASYRRMESGLRFGNLDIAQEFGRLEYDVLRALQRHFPGSSHFRVNPPFDVVPQKEHELDEARTVCAKRIVALEELLAPPADAIAPKPEESNR